MHLLYLCRCSSPICQLVLNTSVISVQVSGPICQLVLNTSVISVQAFRPHLSASAKYICYICAGVPTPSFRWCYSKYICCICAVVQPHLSASSKYICYICAGVPAPSVRWYRDDILIDDSYQGLNLSSSLNQNQTMTRILGAVI
jgi:hypothetical protein